jgi:phosphoglycolate phosphatase
VLQLIVFDLDGTLIDSRRDLADATNALLAELGAGPLDVDQVAAMVGEGAPLLVRRALEAAGLDPATPHALERFLELYDDRLTVHTRPYDGVREMLDLLHSAYELAVLTNKPTAATTRILEAFELAAYFRTIIGGDSPLGRKPSPAGLLHIAALAGATAASTLLVGDSPVDLETARNGETALCLARYGFGYAFDESTLRGTEMMIIDYPLQLAEALRCD